MGLIRSSLIKVSRSSVTAAVDNVISTRTPDGGSFDFLYVQISFDVASNLTLGFFGSLTNDSTTYAVVGKGCTMNPVCGFSASDTSRAYVSSVTAASNNACYIIPVTFNYFSVACTAFVAGTGIAEIYAS